MVLGDLGTPRICLETSQAHPALGCRGALKSVDKPGALSVSVTLKFLGMTSTLHWLIRRSELLGSQSDSRLKFSVGTEPERSWGKTAAGCVCVFPNRAGRQADTHARGPGLRLRFGSRVSVTFN